MEWTIVMFVWAEKANGSAVVPRRSVRAACSSFVMEKNQVSAVHVDE